MDALVTTASSTFSTTIGFGWDSVISYTANLIKLVIGAGLGILQATLGWVIVLIVIGVVVGLLYSAFKFFRHA